MEPILPCAEVAPIAANRVQLLPELILQIVDCVVPPNNNIILPPSHIATRTLIALSTVSDVTYEPAQRLLRQRCLYLDSHRRATSFLQCLQAGTHNTTLPQGLRLAAVHRAPAMFLAPFDRPQLDDLVTARLVRSLLYAAAGSLRRLVVRMPFATLRPAADHRGVRRILREGFAQLAALEEFVGLDEYPDLNLAAAGRRTEDLWSAWPALRRLAVLGADVDEEAFWTGLARSPRLADVVLARPRSVGMLDMKRAYFTAGVEARDQGIEVDESRKIRVMLMDVTYDVLDIQTHGWAVCDPQGCMTVEVYAVPISYYGDETEQETVTAWLDRGVWSGQIWQWRGEVVR